MTEEALLRADLGATSTRAVLAGADRTIAATVQRDRATSPLCSRWFEQCRAIRVGVVSYRTDSPRPKLSVEPAEHREFYDELYPLNTRLPFEAADIAHRLTTLNSGGPL